MQMFSNHGRSLSRFLAVLLVVRRDLAAVAQTKQTLGVRKSAAQNKSRSSGGTSRSNSSSNRKR